MKDGSRVKLKGETLETHLTPVETDSVVHFTLKYSTTEVKNELLYTDSRVGGTVV